MSMDHWGEMFARVDAEVANLRTRLAAAEAERDEARALKAPPTVDELNAALMNAAVAKVERDVAIARAEAAEAEVARLRGAREAALREAAGVVARTADNYDQSEFFFALGPEAQAQRTKTANAIRAAANSVLAMLDAAPAADGGE